MYYRTYKSNISLITNYIRKNNGDEHDAKDLFQTAIISFYEKVKSGEYEHIAKIRSYIYEVVKNRWINELQRRNKKNAIDILNTDENDNSPEHRILDKEKGQIVRKIMKKLNHDCRKILEYSIYQRLDMKKISKLMNYKNEQVARNRKSLCLKELKSIIKNSKHLMLELNILRLEN